MSHEPRNKNLQDYLRVIRQERGIIVLSTLVFAAAALLVSVRQDPTYAADSIIAFREPRADLGLVGGAALFPTQSEQERAAVGAQRVTRIEVARRVKRELRSKLPAQVLLSGVSARAEARTNLVVVQARASNARFARDLSSSFARQTAANEAADYRRRIGRLIRSQEKQLRSVRRRAGDDAVARTLTLERLGQLRSLQQTSTPVEINALATEPSTPISPRPIRNTVLGILIGGTFGLLLAFARDSLDRRLRSREEIQAELGYPLLGVVDSSAFQARNGATPESGDGLESFRIIRTNIEFLDVDHPPHVILVTSAAPGEGKSTVAASLARAMAAAGKTTLLVECDLRRPALSARLGLAPTPGMTDYLLGRATPQEVVQVVDSGARAEDDEASVSTMIGSGTLACITAGVEAPQPAELLASQRFQDFVTQVRSAYETVILDTPPLLAVGDTLELVPLADAVIVCVRSGVTTRDQASGARGALGHMPDKPTGVVITGIAPGDASYGYYSAYTYGYKRGV